MANANGIYTTNITKKLKKIKAANKKWITEEILQQYKTLSQKHRIDH